jgi:hypothetical protein
MDEGKVSMDPRDHRERDHGLELPDTGNGYSLLRLSEYGRPPSVIAVATHPEFSTDAVTSSSLGPFITVDVITL